jgi:pimeloyl-ACP methyl ester carboxylesterase
MVHFLLFVSANSQTCQVKTNKLKMHAFLNSVIYHPPVADPEHDVSVDHFKVLEVPLVRIGFSDHAPTTKVWAGMHGDVTPGAPIVMYCYGNAGYSRNPNTFAFVKQVATYLARGIDSKTHTPLPFVLFDYPGYPKEQTVCSWPTSYCQMVSDFLTHGADDCMVPSEDSAVNAAVEVFRTIRDLYPDHPVILVGQSMGTAIAFRVLAAVMMMSPEPGAIQGCIMISPMYSGKATVKSQFIQNWVLDSFEVFNTRAVIETVNDDIAGTDKQWPPILVFHGDKDTVVPFDHCLTIQRLIGRQCSVRKLKNYDHWIDASIMSTAITEWYDREFSPPSPYSSSNEE